MKTIRLILISLLSWLPLTSALAVVPDDLGGRIEARVDGKPITLPLLKTDIDADVQGDVARVTVTQTFANPLNQAVHATYLFPLNETAAVNAMTMEVGDERIQAKIQRIEEARATFEKARGYVLPRRAADQAAATTTIAKEELKPGDLVFFNTMRRAFSHVGIYIGEGKFIHAPRSGSSVRVDDMHSSYWTSRFNGARRVAGDGNKLSTADMQALSASTR